MTICKNDCLFNELNALLASTIKIASVFWSLYILFIEWITASMQAFCPSQTCSVPVHLMTFSFRTEAITLPAILRKTSPSPLGEVLGFSLMISDGKIETPLLYEFQQDQYTISERHSQISYGDHYLMSQNYWKLEFYASHRNPYLRDLNLL